MHNIILPHQRLALVRVRASPNEQLHYTNNFCLQKLRERKRKGKIENVEDKSEGKSTVVGKHGTKGSA